MIVDRVPLRFGSPACVACVRGLCGEDEEHAAERGKGTAAALALLDGLLVPDEQEGGRHPRAADLTTADRDRVLATVYERAFGAHIVSTVRCARCEAAFDVDFSLRELRAAAAPTGELGADGTVMLDGGRRYRLPNGKDECAAIETLDPAAALLTACALDGVMPGDAAAVSMLMRAAAPVLDTDLDARCPDCGMEQVLRFDVQSYLLASLAAEAPLLVHQVHCIATAYGWSRAEITTMTRERRRAYVALIEAGTKPRRRPRA